MLGEVKVEKAKTTEEAKVKESAIASEEMHALNERSRHSTPSLTKQK